MDKGKYIADAKKMHAYFRRNMAETGSHWKYACDVSEEWLGLVSEEDLRLEYIDEFRLRVLNPPEDQGSAYDELKSMVSRWIDDLKE